MVALNIVAPSKSSFDRRAYHINLCLCASAILIEPWLPFAELRPVVSGESRLEDIGCPCILMYFASEDEPGLEYLTIGTPAFDKGDPFFITTLFIL